MKNAGAPARAGVSVPLPPLAFFPNHRTASPPASSVGSCWPPSFNTVCLVVARFVRVVTSFFPSFSPLPRLFLLYALEPPAETTAYLGKLSRLSCKAVSEYPPFTGSWTAVLPVRF